MQLSMSSVGKKKQPGGTCVQDDARHKTYRSNCVCMKQLQAILCRSGGLFLGAVACKEVGEADFGAVFKVNGQSIEYEAAPAT